MPKSPTKKLPSEQIDRLIEKVVGSDTIRQVSGQMKILLGYMTEAVRLDQLERLNTLMDIYRKYQQLVAVWAAIVAMHYKGKANVEQVKDSAFERLLAKLGFPLDAPISLPPPRNLRQIAPKDADDHPF